ncbi:hypothetical protein ACTA71_011235 [Dictyostelium dimigraforme]
MGQYYTFIKIIELSGGLNNTLSHGQKCQLKPLIENHLFHVNPKLVWEISLDYLLPIITDESIDDGNKKRIIIGTLNKRLISEKHCKKLFNSNGQPNKPIQWGKRSVILFSKKKFPGIEFAVGSLSEKLFGSHTHSNELVLINGESVLLSQQVYAILVNNADGNLGNFIISPTSNPNVNRLISIDNDQSFVHSTNIYENYFKKKEIILKIHTILFLLDEMFEQVHKDVIDSIIKLDMEKLFQDWVNLLMEHHNVTIHLLKCNSKRSQTDNDSTNSKISKKKAKSITHLELLTVLEPLIAIKYKPFLYNKSHSTLEKFIKFMSDLEANKNKLLITPSTINNSKMILESRDIPNPKNFQNELFNDHQLEDLLRETDFKTLDTAKEKIQSFSIGRYDYEIYFNKPLRVSFKFIEKRYYRLFTPLSCNFKQLTKFTLSFGQLRNKMD